MTTLTPLSGFPPLGHGIGLRPKHYPYVLEHHPKVDWFELISENYMIAGGRPLAVLDKIRADYPVVIHGVSLSIGSADPLDMDYLRRLRDLASRARPAWISDHLCWTGIGGHQAHDLLPLPYTEEAVKHVSERVLRVQEFLGRPILLENTSSYLTYRHSVMSEWEFLAAICDRADCGVLFDVNNVYVSAFNHGFSPIEFVEGIPARRVKQFHLAGHTDNLDHLLDTHDHPVVEAVWDLYRRAVARLGPAPTLIEWDDKIPEFPELQAESEKARRIEAEVLAAIPGRTLEIGGGTRT